MLIQAYENPYDSIHLRCPRGAGPSGRNPGQFMGLGWGYPGGPGDRHPNLRRGAEESILDKEMKL